MTVYLEQIKLFGDIRFTINELRRLSEAAEDLIVILSRHLPVEDEDEETAEGDDTHEEPTPTPTE